jgi:cell division protease FtsH
MHLPERDRYTQSRDELMDELAVLMAGRVAEELVFGDITSGAAMDIRQSTDIAKKMVCQWGMSQRLGPLSYTGREEHIFLGRDITRSEDYSEETAREIDQEVRRIIDASEHRARTILTEHREKLLLLGRTLLERETMSAGEVRTLLGIEGEAPSEAGCAEDDRDPPAAAPPEPVADAPP